MIQNVLVIVKVLPISVEDGMGAAIKSHIDYFIKNQFNVFFRNTNNEYFHLDKKNFTRINFVPTTLNFVIFSSLLVAKRYILNGEYKSFIKLTILSDTYINVLIRDIILILRFDFNFAQILKNIIKMPLFYIAEKRIYRESSFVLLQTERDSAVFKKMYFTNSKIVALPNIPQETNYMPNKKRKDIVYLASFIGSYLKISNWFIDNVWIDFYNQSDKNNKLILAGKGSEQYYHVLLSKYPFLKNQITFAPFQEDIITFLSMHKISVAPIYKGYGLMNKVVESVAAGCITIGDKWAFNGLDDISNGKECLIANTSTEFIDKMLNASSGKFDIIHINASNYYSKWYKAQELKYYKFYDNILNENSN